MNKRQKKKNFKKYIKSIQPLLDQQCRDLREFQNPVDCAKAMIEALKVDVESMSNLGIATEKKYWNLDSPVLNQLKDFIRALKI